MKRIGMIACLVATAVVLVYSPSIDAVSLKVAPLKFDIVLKSGEKTKGYVDFSNPESTSVALDFRVQAFRQVDDEGTLQFSDDQQVSQAVALDYTSIELGPREAVHLAFSVDGTKLPQGDTFASIMATTSPTGGSTVQQTVQVGTLLFVTNGTPASHDAEITDLSSAWLQVGDGITTSFRVRNTADPKTTTGFSPPLTVAVAPYTTKQVTGPFVTSGRSRPVAYRQSGDYFGPMVVKVATGDHSVERIVFAATGYWRWVAPLVLVVIPGYALSATIRRNRDKKTSTPVKKTTRITVN